MFLLSAKLFMLRAKSPPSWSMAHHTLSACVCIAFTSGSLCDRHASPVCFYYLLLQCFGELDTAFGKCDQCRIEPQWPAYREQQHLDHPGSWNQSMHTCDVDLVLIVWMIRLTLSLHREQWRNCTLYLLSFFFHQQRHEGTCRPESETPNLHILELKPPQI